MDPFHSFGAQAPPKDSTGTQSPRDELLGTTPAATKPSIRVLDPTPTTREEDLQHGVLIRHMGKEFSETQFPLQLAEADMQLEGAEQADGTQQSTPLARMTLQPDVPRLPTLLSVPSEAGQTFSTDTDTRSLTNLTQNIQHLEVELHERLLTRRRQIIAPFPWLHELSAQDLGLVFGNESSRCDSTVSISASSKAVSEPTVTPSACPGIQCSLEYPCLRVVNAQHSLDLTGIAAIGNWAAPSLRNHFDTIDDAHFSVPTSAGHGSDTEEDMSMMQEELAFDLDDLEPVISHAVAVLEDNYIRSWAPQRSSRKNKTPPAQGATQGNQSAKIQKLPSHPPRGGRGRPKRKGINDDGEDDDENDENKNSGSGSNASTRQTRLLACPFARRYPGQYTCAGKWSELKHVKNHLKKKHNFDTYCVNCYQVFKNGESGHPAGTYCFPKTAPGVEILVMKEQQDAIMRRADTSRSLAERWQYIYEVLFPDSLERCCPFQDDAKTEWSRELVAYLRSEEALRCLRRDLKEQFPPREILPGVLSFVVEKIEERFVSGMLSRDNSGPILDVNISLVDEGESSENNQNLQPKSEEPEQRSDVVDPRSLQCVNWMEAGQQHAALTEDGFNRTFSFPGLEEQSVYIPNLRDSPPGTRDVENCRTQGTMLYGMDCSDNPWSFLEAAANADGVAPVEGVQLDVPWGELQLDHLEFGPGNVVHAAQVDWQGKLGAGTS
ncbi:hypothetical protein HJFPF1_03695 [Paramyrothecium foliicola]|nr:hypothetical protein HJFPF1_03695 [Paramyrothecium foliicola]